MGRRVKRRAKGKDWEEVFSTDDGKEMKG